MKTVFSILAVLALLSTGLLPATYYVATDGDDANPGTMALPLATMQQGHELAAPGDTIYIRGGNYRIGANQIARVEQNLFACVSYFNKSGMPGQTIKFWAYPGEQPVFDFTDLAPANMRVVGIWVAGQYLHIKGLEMTGVQVTITTHTESYCIYSRGSNNIYENISMHDNKGTGLRNYRGGGNLFLNCDAYRNHDDVSENGLGSNTDGFGSHSNPGVAPNIFRGCRAWFNSDDGFDIIRADEPTVFENCWAFYNGYSPNFDELGDGNGFKAGGYAHDPADQIPNPVPRNTIQFCIAVRNKANGFYANHHLAGNDWFNNSAYQNIDNFNMVNRESPEIDNIWFPGYDHVLTNNLSYNPRNLHISWIDTALSDQTNNSFNLPINLSASDFVSVEESLLTAPRNADGSLPDITFLFPAEGSGVIDAGVDIGFPFVGNAPDLGAWETDYPAGILPGDGTVPEGINLFQNYPNPFNPGTEIRYSLAESGTVTLIVYNSLGQKVSILDNGYRTPGEFSATWNGRDEAGKPVASGVYFYRLTVAGISGYHTLMKKMTLLK